MPLDIVKGPQLLVVSDEGGGVGLANGRERSELENLPRLGEQLRRGRRRRDQRILVEQGTLCAREHIYSVV